MNFLLTNSVYLLLLLLLGDIGNCSESFNFSNNAYNDYDDPLDSHLDAIFGSSSSQSSKKDEELYRDEYFDGEETDEYDDGDYDFEDFNPWIDENYIERFCTNFQLTLFSVSQG